MADVFVDTFYYLARLSRNDAAHHRAIEVSRRLSGRTVTTAWVLTEVADALHAPQLRGAAANLYETLLADSSVTIVPAEQALYDRGWEMYRQRPDKAWSLTDCISFVLMQERNLQEALTGDQHFEQAGFVALLK
ncbi:MAG: type II toxin-antitoxin system VapC family toxin [Pirellulales bacterium]